MVVVVEEKNHQQQMEVEGFLRMIDTRWRSKGSTGCGRMSTTSARPGRSLTRTSSYMNNFSDTIKKRELRSKRKKRSKRSGCTAGRILPRPRRR